MHFLDSTRQACSLYESAGVNIAARIQSLADIDEICVSQDVARQVQHKLDVPLLNLGRRALKNIELPVDVYRAGLGIANAVAEIKRRRGTAYDPAVADACLRLFGAKGYAIPA